MITVRIYDDEKYIAILQQLIERLTIMARTLDEVLAKVTEQDTMLDGIRELIRGLRDQVKDAGRMSPTDQAKVDAIFDKVESNLAETATALTENVPPQ